MMKHLQKLDRAIMLPVTVLLVTVIMMGVGYAICPVAMQNGDVTGIVQITGFALTKTSNAIIDKLPMLFTASTTISSSEDQHGATGLAGLVALLTVTTVPNSGVAAVMVDVEEASLALSKIGDVFIGIISGITVSICYNRFSGAQLPTASAFFSGKCYVSIVTSFVMAAESAIPYFIWSMLFNAPIWVGEQIMEPGPVGVGPCTFTNRLLILIGLHHVLNVVFWFDITGTADTNKFWGSVEGGIKGVTGMYQVGFSPVMMFGLPTAALAMYQAVRSEKKRCATGILIVGAAASLVSGATEPLEFSSMFLAPGLYLTYAVLTGISVAVAIALHWTAGFCSSASVTDLILNRRLPMTNQSFMLLVQGVVFTAIYYVVFRVVITKFDLPTPGREKEDLDVEMAAVLVNGGFTKVAAIALEGLDGKGNVVSLDNRITGLRLETKDYTLIDEKKIKPAGVAGVMRPNKTFVQVIVGIKIQFVVDKMQKVSQQ